MLPLQYQLQVPLGPDHVLHYIGPIFLASSRGHVRTCRGEQVVQSHSIFCKGWSKNIEVSYTIKFKGDV